MIINDFFTSVIPRARRAKLILKNEGFWVLVKQITKHYAFLFSLPFCFRKIKRIKFDSIDRLVDFVFCSYFGYLAPIQVRSEIISLLRRVKELKPRVIMEIGTAQGGTLFSLARVAPDDSLMIGLDLPRRRRDYPWWKLRLFKSFARNKQQIYLIRKDSHREETLAEVKKILNGRPIDFLFIDGDHSYDGIKRDFELYSPLVRRGGIIALHDVARHPLQVNCRVDMFWQELKDKHEFEEFIENERQAWAGIGLIKI
ncbi:MAG: class I SAM-dependent methyltransferase [Candidatus Portnoybacteria bacterium]|nr:class I SAM-dependent methyltransferase [Candidatus Portnoybacteria bacterium]MDD4982491.1 class I SAM-dependent methyltransferase [Candidatus Portnoybacteria bacterium]